MSAIELTTRDDPEKAHPQVSIRETTSTEQLTEKREAVQWQTGFLVRFPWIGFGAMLVMLISIALVGVVLGTSNGKFRNEWPSYERWNWLKGHEEWRKQAQIEPHVLLAIINTVTNVSLAIAIGHGVAIAWWRRAMVGSTVEVRLSCVSTEPRTYQLRIFIALGDLLHRSSNSSLLANGST
jgi:hypothetical protein